MSNLSKTYKFIYFTNYNQYAALDKKQRTEYTFGNRKPKGFHRKYDVYSFFERNDDRTMRNHLQERKTRKINCVNFLPKNLPANEANITFAFVKMFTFRLNDCRRKLTYLTKQAKLAETDKINFPHGFNPMNYNVYNPEYYRTEIKHAKENLKIWKAKYQQLKDQGVYTYLELTK